MPVCTGNPKLWRVKVVPNSQNALFWQLLTSPWHTYQCRMALQRASQYHTFSPLHGSYYHCSPGVTVSPQKNEPFWNFEFPVHIETEISCKHPKVRSCTPVWKVITQRCTTSTTCLFWVLTVIWLLRATANNTYSGEAHLKSPKVARPMPTGHWVGLGELWWIRAWNGCPF